MAIQLEFINLIIKRESIQQLVTGGWEGFIDQMQSTQFNNCFDEHLFRTGAMSYGEAFDIANQLVEMGLRGLDLDQNYLKTWVDFCVYDSSIGTEHSVGWLDLEYHRAYPYAIRLTGDSDLVVQSPDTCYSPFRRNDLALIHEVSVDDEDIEWGAIRQAQGRRAYKEWLEFSSR